MLKNLLFVLILLLVCCTAASAGTGQGKGSCIYCHAGGPPVGDGTVSGCGGCHSMPTKSAGHPVHTDGSGAIYGNDANSSTSTTYRFNCGNCHPAGAIKHGDNAVQVELYNAAASGFKAKNPATAARTGTGTQTVCSNVYCHSAGQPGGTNSYVATPAWGGSFSGNRCAGCHNNPPSYPNGSPKANSHLAHSFSCDTCHSSTTSDGMSIANHANHVNGAVEVTPGGSVSFSYSYGAGGGTCGNISCHANTDATWGGTVSCSACHGNPPPKAAAGYTALDEAQTPHLKHAGQGGYYSFSCDQCHKGNSRHGGGNYQQVFLDTTGILAGTGAAYNTSTRTCTNVYCHSNGAPIEGAAYKAVSWTAKLPSDCTGCHGGNSLSAAPVASGSHAAHISRADTGYGCALCHRATVTLGNDRAVTGLSSHADGVKSVSFLGGGVYSPAPRSCASTLCHQAGKGTAPQPAAPVWGGAALGCNGCHGTGNAIGAPDYPNAGGAAPLANSHVVHATKAADCASCHASTVDAAGRLTGTSHANGTIDVAAGAGKSFSYGANKTCSNISCHSGDGLIANVAGAQWGASLGCAGCHGDSSTLAGSAHAKHVNPASGKGYSCDVCHVNTVAGSSTIINATLHGNGVADVAGAVLYTPATKSCSTACHLSAAPQWNVPASGACGTCHPALSGTANGTIATGAHAAHLSAGYGPGLDGASTASCSMCHVYTSDLSATHGNGTVELAAGYSKNGTCSTCHRQSTVWSGGEVSCESCHSSGSGPLSVIGGITAPDKAQASTVGHGKSGINQGCTSCHDRNSAHIFGTASSAKRLLPALTGTLNAECSYCHNDSAKVPDPPFRNMSTHFVTLGGGQQMTCATCHDVHGTANLAQIRTIINGRTVTYTDRVNGLVDTVTNQGLCQVCHSQTAHYTAGVAETSHPTTSCFNCHKHNAEGGAFKPNGSCDACHGYPPAPKRMSVAVTFGVMNNWSGARFEDYSGGGGAHLVAQHVSPSARPSEGWVNCTMCHNAGATTSAPYHRMTTPVSKHIDNVHMAVDPKYRFAEGFISYTGAQLVNPPAVNATGSCLNVSCHMGPSPRWSIER